MAAVQGSMDSHLFELRNFTANELLFRDRHSNKIKPGRGNSPGRMSPSSRRGMNSESQVKGAQRGSPGTRSPSVDVENQVPAAEGSLLRTKTLDVKAEYEIPSSGESPQATAPAISLESQVMTTAPTIRVEPRGSNNSLRALAICDDNTRKRTADVQTVIPSLDEDFLRKLAKMVIQEMRGTKKMPIHLDDFSGEKSSYLAENAMVWLKKLRLAARQNEWDYAQALEVSSIHLKGLAARWFASIEKYLNEELHLDRDRWNYFQSQFEERFADFRSRLFQIEKIRGLKLKDGEDVREYAEAIMSMNSRLDDPLDDEFLRWVFIQGIPPSELREKLSRFEENPTNMANAVKYARRFQLSQSVFNIKDSVPRTSLGSMQGRTSVRSN